MDTAKTPIVKVWSPSNPKELIVLNTQTEHATRIIVAEKEHEDCNEFERRALRSLMDVAESRTASSSPLDVAKEYRNSMCRCLDEWTDALEEDAASPIELLALDRTCHTLQLAEIFLPAHDFQAPALLTADTVRYLRNQYSRLPFAMDSIEIRRELQHAYDMDRPCFWENMTLSVITGRLHLATDLLLQLPLIANVLSMDENDADAAINPNPQEQGRLLEEVWNLVTMLRKAPIPGSPFDTRDDGLSSYDEVSMMEYAEDMDVNFGDVHRSVAYLETDAYVQWEPSSSVFSPPGASRALQHWQQTLQKLQFPVLFKRFAPLQELISIACGNRAGTRLQNRPWWDVLLCQIIYQTPTLKPHDLINRMTSLVEGTGHEWIVPILQGAGSVALEEIINQRTTAPLPGALRALWFDLCVGWKVLADDEETQAELVCATAESIVVNHEDTPDEGMQLATRFIVLHALRSKRRAAFENYTGFLAALLENHIPSTEDYAMTLLRYCEPLFSEHHKSIPVVESCVDILRFVFKRHLDSLDKDTSSDFLIGLASEVRENFKAAVRVMETALRVEISVYGENASVIGRVHGFMDRFCLDTCQSMLKIIVDSDAYELETLPTAQAKGLLEACTDESMAVSILPSLACFQELEAIFMLFSVTMGETTPTADEIGAAISSCLEVCGSKYEDMISLLMAKLQTTRGESERGSILGDGALELTDRVHDTFETEQWALLHTEATNRYIVKNEETWS